jgi:hypothetical protein
MHRCALDADGNGIAEADVMTVSVACAGPETSIQLVGHEGWLLDPTEGEQTFEASAFVANTTFIIAGPDLVMATVNGGATPIRRVGRAGRRPPGRGSDRRSQRGDGAQPRRR